MLSKTAQDKVVGNIDQPLLDILDIKLERNSFGRQRESFESDISLNSIGIPSFNGVFIRAPAISDVGSDVEVLSKFNEKIVAIKKNNIIGVAFHPELTSDISLHKYYIDFQYLAQRTIYPDGIESVKAKEITCANKELS